MTLTHPWKLLSYDSTDDGTVTYLMAAAAFDGIGVLASWTRQPNGSWTCWVVDTEQGAPRDDSEAETDPVPAAPPIRPNRPMPLQNIPIRSPEGKRVSEFFRRWDR